MTPEEVTAESVADAEEAHAAWEAGDLSDGQFVALAAAVVLRANTRATVLADVGLARELSAITGTSVYPLGLVLPSSEPARLRGALSTLVEDEPTRERVVRLADNEPKAATVRARGEGVRRSPQLSGWTRTLNGAKSCKPCTDMADGSVLSGDTPMWRHVGCDCTQTLVPKPGDTAPPREIDPALAGMSGDWLRHQIAVTEGLKSSAWRTKQLARLRNALANQ